MTFPSKEDIDIAELIKGHRPHSPITENDLPKIYASAEIHGGGRSCPLCNSNEIEWTIPFPEDERLQMTCKKCGFWTRPKYLSWDFFKLRYQELVEQRNG